MNLKFPRTRYAAKSAYYFCVAFTNNLIAEYLDRRFEKKKRNWIALGTHGAGCVPLGKVNMDTARDKTAKFGTVVNVDVEQAIVFYSEKQ